MSFLIWGQSFTFECGSWDSNLKWYLVLPHVLGKIYIWNPIWCHVSNMWNLRPNKSSLKLNLLQTGNKQINLNNCYFFLISSRSCKMHEIFAHINQRTSCSLKVTKLIPLWNPQSFYQKLSCLFFFSVGFFLPPFCTG